jgi:hypothetical protein
MRAALTPPVLSGAFRALDPHGTVTRSGYQFRIFLPGRGGVGIGEAATGFDGHLIDADLAEEAWCAYAWPADPGVSGDRTFFVSQSGDLQATTDERYSGPGGGPAADAAFVVKGNIVGPAAIGVKGSDGNVWREVN